MCTEFKKSPKRSVGSAVMVPKIAMHQVNTFTRVIIDLPLYCMHTNMQLSISNLKNCNLLYTHTAHNSVALYMQEYNSINYNTTIF